MDIDKIMKIIEDNAIEIVRFEQEDAHGIAISRDIPIRHFRKKAEKGLFFSISHVVRDPTFTEIDGIDSTKYGNGDALCFPDLDTFAVLPWCDHTARVLIEPTRDGVPLASYPRVVAKRQLEKLTDLGYSLFTSHEMEFILFHRDTKEPINTDHRFNATLRNNQDTKFSYQVMRQLPKVGVDIECLESEASQGSCEYTYAPAFGIRAADNAHTFKLGVKEIALQHNYIASFMSMPFTDKARIEGEDGNNVHICHSLWDLEGKVPLTYDSSEPDGLSQIARHWIAGILAHAPAITVLMSSTANCMSLLSREVNRRIPHEATWGKDNREACIRAKIHGPKGSYFEFRLGGGTSNPYVQLAATVAAGVDGIKRKLPLPEETIGSEVPPGTAMLPTNVKDGVQAFLQDEVITEAMGKDFVDVFVALKTHEIKLEEEAKAKGDINWMRELYLEYC